MSERKPTPDEIAMAQAAGLEVQPDPEPNSLPSAHDLVTKRILLDFPNPDAHSDLTTHSLTLMLDEMIELYCNLCGTANLAIEEMRKRKEFGLTKYGTLLQPFNGRDALADARDEMGDLLVYLAVRVYELQHPYHAPGYVYVEGAYDDDREAGWG